MRGGPNGSSSSRSRRLWRRSPKAGTGAGDLTPEQEYRVRVMGEEELELLRAAASQEDGLPLASLNWILASLANHGFVTISPSNDRRLRAAAPEAGHLALEMRPLRSQ
jgi:hypothetical protein